jgi:hypothetical protein
MTFDLEEAIAVLERTPRVLRAMLDELPEAWTRATEGGETWSPYDVVGHLIHGERTDWIPRARILLEHGEARPFPPFDRAAMKSASVGKSLGELLDTFEGLRGASVAALRGLRLTADDLARTGTHPEFGAVTLEQLLATWVAHDLDHIVQIARTMAKQYGAAVGPWSAYLRVVR